MAKETATVEKASEQAITESAPFIGQWNNLVSTTNWDKGEIICDWRKQLEDSGSDAGDYSDEAWSKMVGGVTPQHVGRLRRTFERFGHVFKEYKRLYWSHFYASLDWDDAEMWLEGAVQNTWSISKMRHQRWETLGKIPEDKPSSSDIVVSEADEELQSLALTDEVSDRDREYVEGPRHDGPDFGDEQGEPRDKNTKERSLTGESGEFEEPKKSSDPIKPFEAFTDLPKDVAAAADSFKIAIIRHRAANWEEIKQDEMLGLLDAMKQLTKIEN